MGSSFFELAPLRPCLVAFKGKPRGKPHIVRVREGKSKTTKAKNTKITKRKNGGEGGKKKQLLHPDVWRLQAEVHRVRTVPHRRPQLRPATGWGQHLATRNPGASEPRATMLLRFTGFPWVTSTCFFPPEKKEKNCPVVIGSL